MFRTFHSLFGFATFKKSTRKANVFHKKIRMNFDTLEDRVTPAATPTFVNDNWALITDNSPTGLSVGDIVRNDNDTFLPGTITKTYGVDAFGKVTTGAFTGSLSGSATINDAIAG